MQHFGTARLGIVPSKVRSTRSSATIPPPLCWREARRDSLAFVWIGGALEAMEASACEGRTAQIRALPCSLEGQTSGTKEEEKQKTEQKKAGGPRLNVWNARRCADLEAFQQEPLKQLVLFALQEPARKASPPFRRPRSTQPPRNRKAPSRSRRRCLLLSRVRAP